MFLAEALMSPGFMALVFCCLPAVLVQVRLNNKGFALHEWWAVRLINEPQRVLGLPWPGSSHSFNRMSFDDPAEFMDYGYRCRWHKHTAETLAQMASWAPESKHKVEVFQLTKAYPGWLWLIWIVCFCIGLQVSSTMG